MPLAFARRGLADDRRSTRIPRCSAWPRLRRRRTPTWSRSLEADARCAAVRGRRLRRRPLLAAGPPPRPRPRPSPCCARCGASRGSASWSTTCAAACCRSRPRAVDGRRPRAQPRDPHRRHRLGAPLLHARRARRAARRRRPAAGWRSLPVDAARRDRGVADDARRRVVVGAGPAGSAAAAGLARAGRARRAGRGGTPPAPQGVRRVRQPADRRGAGAHRPARPRRGSDCGPAGRHGDARAAAGRARIGYADRRGPRSAWGVDRRTFDETPGAPCRRRAAPTCARACASCGLIT